MGTVALDVVRCTNHDVQMTRPGKAQTVRRSAAALEAVGVAEFRANLAKYLKQASVGRRVIVRERGRRAYVLSSLEEEAAPSIVGCMRERTELGNGEVVNALESWRAGPMP